MGLVLGLVLDLGREAIQVIQEDPHRVCIQTGANDRMDLVVIPDQTRVHRAISVEEVVAVIPVVIPVVIQVAMQVVGITMVEVVVIPVAIPVAIIQEAEEVVIQVAIQVVIPVAIQEDI